MKKIVRLAMAATTLLSSSACLANAKYTSDCRINSRYVWNSKTGKKEKVRIPSPPPPASIQSDVPWAGQLVPVQNGEIKWCRMTNAGKR
jgi:hypothetical protein